jgi:DNA uptake protein ComE-like DNA-binding protein
MKSLSPNPRSRALARRRSSCGGERSSVLVIVLWITFGVVSLALYFAQSANFEFRAADNRVATLEAEQAIAGAARYVSNVLSAVLLQTNLPTALPDRLSYQQAGVSVGEARFWLIGRDTNYLQTGPVLASFGLVDEASKLNLNTATVDMLEWLPGMTPDLAANIVSWRQSTASSSNSNSGSMYGVTAEAYTQLIPSYECKAAPYETVDELRLVYGLTPDLLYGEDMNLNGVLDANENDGEVNPPSDNSNGLLESGLLEYVTVWTLEPNTASDGSVRINVTNATELTPVLQEKFGDSRSSQILQSAGFTTAATGGGRGGGASGGTGATGGGRGGSGSVAVIPTFRSVLEFYLQSGMTEDEFAQIADNIATTTNSTVQGLVNINTASAAVLGCIPGIGSNTAPAVVSYRLGNSANLTSVAWIANVLDRTNAILAGPYITARSYQFSADVAAVGHFGRGYRRVKFIFDISEGTPKILYRQDLTHLGWALGKDVREKLLLANNKR